jgi:hypothetical protein
MAAFKTEAPTRLSARESELLEEINRGFPVEFWERYRSLIAKRQQEALAPDELAELIERTDQLEAANVERVARLSELARLRGLSLTALMDALGIQPVRYA